MPPVTATALKMTKARVALITQQPFFGSLALHLEVRSIPGIETMRTNGKTLDYDPTWVDKLTQTQLTAVVAHEVMHCALHHQTRRGARDPKQWNVACDYAVNLILKDAGFDLPKEGLLDKRFAGMSAEAIYDLLQDESGDGGKGGGKPSAQPGAGNSPEIPGSSPPGNDHGGCGEVVDAPGEDGGQPSDATNTAHDRQWDVATLQAAQIGKTAGKLPGCLAELVNAIKHPSVDYREALRRFMLSRIPSDSAWTPPNRRYISRGLYLPSLRCERLGEIVVAIDTSGSTRSFRPQFAGDVSAISEDLQPERLHVIYADTAVQKHDEYEPGEAVTPNMMGGGGTDFRPIFDYVAKRGIEPACLILLTDLEGPLPTLPPDYPVLFICTDNSVAPWGETIKMEIRR